MRFRDKNGPTLYPILQTAGFAGFFRRRAHLGAFTNFNALYGVFGTIMGLLLWIYFSGVILLLGGCIAATMHSQPNAGNAEDSVTARTDRN